MKKCVGCESAEACDCEWELCPECCDDLTCEHNPLHHTLKGTPEDS